MCLQADQLETQGNDGNKHSVFSLRNLPAESALVVQRQEEIEKESSLKVENRVQAVLPDSTVLKMICLLHQKIS